MNKEAVETQYDITKERCQTMIDRSPVVCPCCGGKLEPLETVNNSGVPTFWAGCAACQSFSWGFSPEVFKIANHMVRERHYQHYSHMPRLFNPTPAEEDYWYKSQIGGTCSLVSTILNLQKELANGL